MPKKRGGSGNRGRTTEQVLGSAIQKAVVGDNALASVSGFGSNVVSDIASIPESLWDLVNAVGGRAQERQEMYGGFGPDYGGALGEFGRASIEDTIATYRDPVEYFKEHPGFALLDLIGLGFGGTRALTSAARRADMSVPQFLKSEVGAIGPIGKRLETGEPPLEIVFEKQMSNTAAAPSKGRVRYPDVEGDVLMKLRGDVSGNHYAQAEGEIASHELNRLAGERLTMAGVQSHPGIPYRRGSSSPGALIEFVPGLDEPKHIRDFSEDIDISTPEGEALFDRVTQDMRDISIFDAITGNTDRFTGHNLGRYRKRPLLFDQGLALRERGHDWGRNLRPGEIFGPLDAWRSAGREVGELSPDEMAWVSALDQALQNPTDLLTNNVSQRALHEALARAQLILQRGNLYESVVPDTSGFGAARRLGSGLPRRGGGAANPAGVQKLLQDIARAAPVPPSTSPSAWEIQRFGDESVTPAPGVRSQAFMDPAEEAMRNARYADEFGGDEVDIVVRDGIEQRSQFPSPTPVPAPEQAAEHANLIADELSKILPPADRQLMRSILKRGLEEDVFHALDFVKKVWAKRGNGPLPAPPAEAPMGLDRVAIAGALRRAQGLNLKEAADAAKALPPDHVNAIVDVGRILRQMGYEEGGEVAVQMTQGERLQWLRLIAKNRPSLFNE